MCMFSKPVSYVGDTNIFARGSTGVGQFLVYSMRYQAGSELAMILPLPTPPSPPEDAVRFIDLSAYPKFFDDMDKGFSKPLTRGSAAFAAAAAPTLKVHEVGSFHASFVPRLRDFARLDGRFRLPEQAWEQVPQYGDYAFAVFKLQAGAKNVHPMAFEFPRRDPRELFFPTVHVHDGGVEAYADFDHSLFWQSTKGRVGGPFSLVGESSYDCTDAPAGRFMDIDRARGVVDAEAMIQMQRLGGWRVNRDVVVREGR